MSAPFLSVLDIRLGRLRRALHEGDGGFSPGFFPALFDLLLLSVQLILGPSSNDVRSVDLFDVYVFSRLLFIVFGYALDFGRLMLSYNQSTDVEGLGVVDYGVSIFH
ncbi:hypothetical protein YC2023_044708 [Brassica napus]